MDEANAEMAEDLRRRMHGQARLIFGLSLLGMGVPAAGACLTLAFLLPLPAPYVGVLAVALFLMAALASFGLMRMQQGRTRRSIALIGLADELGLLYEEAAKAALTGRLRGMEMFAASNGIAASNVLSGRIEGLSVAVMDCVVSAGQANFEGTVFLVRGVPARVPDFYLTPRDFLSRGSAGVEIPGASEFNKRFLLRGEDRRAIREAFDAEVIGACLAGKDQNVEARRPLLAVMRRGGRLPLAQFRPFLRNCVRLAKALGVAEGRSTE